jgi:hypothetical protein
MLGPEAFQILEFLDFEILTYLPGLYWLSIPNVKTPDMRCFEH